MSHEPPDPFADDRKKLIDDLRADLSHRMLAVKTWRGHAEARAAERDALRTELAKARAALTKLEAERGAWEVAGNAVDEEHKAERLEAQARIAMLHEALTVSRFELPLLCMAGSSETLHEREREMMRRFNAALAATAEQVAAWRASVESAARSDERARVVDAINGDFTRVYPPLGDIIKRELRAKADARVKALKEAVTYLEERAVTFKRTEDRAMFVLAAHDLRALVDPQRAEPTPNDERLTGAALLRHIIDTRYASPVSGVSQDQFLACVTAVLRLEDAEDVHSPAFYRVGQTGVERALPVAVADAPAQHEMVVCDESASGRRDGWVARCSCGWVSLPNDEEHADDLAQTHKADAKSKACVTCGQPSTCFDGDDHMCAAHCVECGDHRRAR